MPAASRPARAAHPNLVLVASILTSSLAMIDGSVVNVGLPAIGRALNGQGEDLQWVINAYLLPLSAMLLLGGALGDRYGRRRVLMIGVALFAAASAACALAPGLGWLFAGRAIQGLGAALLLPNSLAVLGDAFPGKARGRAVGLWAATSAMAAALGPVAGGGLIDTIGWRSIFFLNLPLAAGAIALAWFGVPPDRTDGKKTPLDLAGAALVTAALAALTWAMTVASASQTMSGWAWTAALGGVALFGAFIAVEARLKEKAMAPLSLFASRTFVGLSLLTLLIYGVLGGFMVLLPYALIKGSGYSATSAGAALIPFPVLLAALSPAVGALAGRIGSRWLLVGGGLVLAAGLALCLRIGENARYWTQVLPGIVVLALGMSGIAAPLTNAVLGSVDEKHTGSASGLNSAISRTGGLIATALLGGVFAAREGVLDKVHMAILAGIGVTLAGAACGLLVQKAERAS